MTLSYDFDMFAEDRPVMRADEVPCAPPDTVRHHGKVALFRDARTSAALASAPPSVQDYLRASGFGTGNGHSGAPAGRYPLADEVARTGLIEALASNIADFELPRADDKATDPEDFSLPAFFEAVMTAEPLPSDAPLLPPAPAPEQAEVSGIPSTNSLWRSLKLPLRAPRWLFMVAAGALAVWTTRAI